MGLHPARIELFLLCKCVAPSQFSDHFELTSGQSKYLRDRRPDRPFENKSPFSSRLEEVC
jgi:hypothetical protein